MKVMNYKNCIEPTVLSTHENIACTFCILNINCFVIEERQYI